MYKFIYKNIRRLPDDLAILPADITNSKIFLKGLINFYNGNVVAQRNVVEFAIENEVKINLPKALHNDEFIKLMILEKPQILKFINEMSDAVLVELYRNNQEVLLYYNVPEMLQDGGLNHVQKYVEDITNKLKHEFIDIKRKNLHTDGWFSSRGVQSAIKKEFSQLLHQELIETIKNNPHKLKFSDVKKYIMRY